MEMHLNVVRIQNISKEVKDSCRMTCDVLKQPCCVDNIIATSACYSVKKVMLDKKWTRKFIPKISPGCRNEVITYNSKKLQRKATNRTIMIVKFLLANVQ